MKNSVKSRSNRGWKTLLFSLFLLIGSSGFSAPPSVTATLSCVIESLQGSAQSQGTASFSWNAVSGASGYKLYYVRLADSYTSQQITVSGTAHTFTGLSSGSHRFFFAPICGGGTLEYITDDLIVL